MDNKNKNAMPPEDFAPLYKIAAVMIAAGALMLCLSFARLEYPLLKFGVMGLGITLICMGVAFIFIINSAKKFTKQKHNYFLLNNKIDSDIMSMVKCVRSKLRVILLIILAVIFYSIAIKL